MVDKKLSRGLRLFDSLLGFPEREIPPPPPAALPEPAPEVWKNRLVTVEFNSTLFKISASRAFTNPYMPPDYEQILDKSYKAWRYLDFEMVLQDSVEGESRVTGFYLDADMQGPKATAYNMVKDTLSWAKDARRTYSWAKDARRTYESCRWQYGWTEDEEWKRAWYQCATNCKLFWEPLKQKRAGYFQNLIDSLSAQARLEGKGR